MKNELRACPFIGVLSASSTTSMFMICSQYVYVVLIREEPGINGQAPMRFQEDAPSQDYSTGYRGTIRLFIIKDCGVCGFFFNAAAAYPASDKIRIISGVIFEEMGPDAVSPKIRSAYRVVRSVARASMNEGTCFRWYHGCFSNVGWSPCVSRYQSHTNP